MGDGYSSYSSRALTVKPNFTNSGASTINVSGLGTASIYKNVSGVATALVAGDIVSGIPAILICDGTNFLLTNPTSTASSSGALILLKTINAAAQASVVFDSTVITSAYNKYVIEYDGLYTAAGSDDLRLSFSTNNGSTYITSGYYSNGIRVISGTVTGTFDNNTAYIDITGANSVLGSSASAPTSGTIKFSNPSASAQINVDISCSTPQTSGLGFFKATGTNTSTTAINNGKIVSSDASNITGNFHLYGIAGN